MQGHSSRPAVKCSVIAIHSALAALGMLALAAPVHAQTDNAVPAAPVEAPADGAASAAPAPALTPAESAAPAPVPMQSVVVSASRIDRAGYAAPTPTTTVGAATLEQRATVNIGDLLNEMPAFRASNTPSSGGIGNNGSILANLRGLTPVRTMVLLNRARLPKTIFPDSRTSGTTDLSIVPTGILRNVDVVTGGASAAYGSDAVAGVVNMVIDDAMEGVKATVQGGQTRYHDARDKFVSVTGGTSFAGGRGHIVAGAEYNDNDGTDIFNTKRAWGANSWEVLAVPNPRPAGVAANVIRPNARFANIAPGGLISQSNSNPAALRGLTFVPNANGSTTTAPFDYGQFPGVSFMAGGTNALNYQQLRAAIERANFLSHVTYKLSDNVTAYVEPLYARLHSTNIGPQRRDGGGMGPALTFRRDNYYLNNALTDAQRALLTDSGLAIGYMGNDFGPSVIDTRATTSRLLAGVRGNAGGSWKWDAYVQSGKSVVDYDISKVHNNPNFMRAIDAVQVTAANVGTSGLPLGSVVCRSTLTTPGNGCSPVNILGRASGSEAAYAYIFGTASSQTISKLHEASFSLQGEPLSTWAGPVSVGTGLDFRKEELETTVDPISQAGGWSARAPVAQPHASYNVKEAYLETIVPLARHLMLAKSLDFNAAVRRTDYSTSGGVTTWKGGLSWEPMADFRLRGTRSRDIRAPNLGELYTPTTPAVPLPTVRDPRAAFNNSYNTQGTAGGNADLKPEISNTTTFGVVFQPSSLKRLSMSADYYRIRINDAIGTSAAQAVVDSCLAGGVLNPSSPYCSQITFANNDPVRGAITRVASNSANVASFRTDGVDLQASYTQPMKELNGNLAGTLNLNLQATRTFEYWTSTDISALFPEGINRAGQTGAGFGGPAGLPKWTANASLSYRLKRLMANVQVRHISRSHQNNGFIGPDDPAYSPTLGNSIDNNMIPSMTYVNLGASYDFGTNGRRELFFTVDNAFDRDPPNPANNNAYYDLMGRTYKLGLRVSFD
ncbi:TonB-dependent receptor domain-containing protein [Massilia niastensis]|uniref:TonB-dependent receptor domain-containing protein n=1 Tax=Massilia niastensis TaxID=544911 RepID=UPI0003AAC57D|nr:TonB-dependent receptor [Massilia niastensis]